MSADRRASRPPDRGPPSDDRALLRAHVDGDPDAFGALFARHRDRLWAVALRTTGDPEDAADALQDGADRGVPAGRLLPRRRRRHHLAAPDRGQRLPRPAAPPPGTARRPAARRPRGRDAGRERRAGRPATPAGRRVVDPADVAVDRERRAAVLAALATLPPDQRAALVLVDMEGYPVAGGRRDPRLRPGTVKSAAPAGGPGCCRSSPSDRPGDDPRPGEPVGRGARPIVAAPGSDRRPTTPRTRR